MTEKIICQLEIDLNKLGIKNDGTSPVETSAGLNQLLKYAGEQGFTKIVFPKGIYLIHESNPLIIDIKNIVIDLNGSILQAGTNGDENSTVVEIRAEAENVRFINGTITGNINILN